MTDSFIRRESPVPRGSTVPHDRAQIKWGSVTKSLTNRDKRWGDVVGKIRPIDVDPAAHDVLIGRIVQLSRHMGIELDNGRKAGLRQGDLVGLAFGHRYATLQYDGEVPPMLPLYDMLSQGGVCGRVVAAASTMEAPTKIQPMGYLLDERHEIVNLRRYALRQFLNAPRVATILVVGSSMDAGKTTMAASIIAGLTAAGKTVHAGKLTGTACVKDLDAFTDAGAAFVLDFNHVGFASTFRATTTELHTIGDTLISNLSAERPDFLVLEIADGVIQQETRVLLTYLTTHQLVDYFCLAVQDALAAPACLELLTREWGIHVTAISGIATISALSTAELAGLVSPACLASNALASPDIERLFGRVVGSGPKERGSILDVPDPVETDRSVVDA